MPRFQIDLTADTFRRDLRSAKRTHPSIDSDLAEVFSALEDCHDLGDWIPGVGAHVRKLRVGVKQARIPKRKGYRLIYYVDLEKSVIIPLLFHYKPDIQLIPPKEIAKALKAMLEKTQAVEPLPPSEPRN